MTYYYIGDMVNYTSNEPIKLENLFVIINTVKSRKEMKTNVEGAENMNEILTQEKSIYLQISEMIENDILRDIILEEERVPSTNELAKIYAINPATAAKGINILVDSGVLYKKRGIGMFVASGAKENIKKRRQAEFSDKYIKTLLTEAESIGITKEELIRMIKESV